METAVKPLTGDSIAEPYNLRVCTLNVPLRLAEYALKEKKTYLLQLYIYLSFQGSGKVIITTFLKDKTAIDLGVTVRNINGRLAQLKKLNWIGYNPKTGYTYIRGVKYVCSLYKLNFRAAYEFSSDWLPFIDEFCFAAFITYLLSYRRWRTWKPKRSYCDSKNRPGLFLSSPFQGAFNELYRNHKNALRMFPSPFLARQLCMSVSTISLLKKSTAQTGLLSITHNRALISEKRKEVYAINCFREANPDIARKLWIKDKQLYLILPDSFKSTLKRKTLRLRGGK